MQLSQAYFQRSRKQWRLNIYYLTSRTGVITITSSVHWSLMGLSQALDLRIWFRFPPHRHQLCSYLWRPIPGTAQDILHNGSSFYFFFANTSSQLLQLLRLSVFSSPAFCATSSSCVIIFTQLQTSSLPTSRFSPQLFCGPLRSPSQRASSLAFSSFPLFFNTSPQLLPASSACVFCFAFLRDSSLCSFYSFLLSFSCSF